MGRSLISLDGPVVFQVLQYKIEIIWQNDKECAVKINTKDAHDVDAFWLPNNYETVSGACYGVLLWMEGL